MTSFVKHKGEWVVSLPNKVPKDFRVTVKKKDGTSTTVIVGDLLVDDENKTLYRFSNVPESSRPCSRSHVDPDEEDRRIKAKHQQFLGEHAGDQFASAADDNSDPDPDDFDEVERYHPFDF